MATDLRTLLKQIDAVIAEFDGTPRTQLNAPATNAMGNRFNQLRSLVEQALPDIKDQLPRPVKTHSTVAPGPGVTEASNLDIKSFLRELGAIVDQEITDKDSADIVKMNR